MPDQIIHFLKESTTIPGLPGFEKPAADLVAQWFGKYTGDVWQDPFYNTFARMGGGSPKVMVAAHTDGLGLMVMSVEDDGFLGFATLGGFDPRVLPGLEVTVHGREGDYFGVIGAKPPHVLSEEDRKKVLKVDELFIDVGMPKEMAARFISVGDIISLRAPLVELAGGVVAGRALDDRAGIALMLETMKNLKKKALSADVVFTATTREEVGSYGAMTGAFAVKPDLAVIIDVCHAVINSTDDPRMVPFNLVNLGIGPVLDRRLRMKLEQTAKKLGIEIAYDVMNEATSTDADEVQVSRTGVPVALLQLPLRYMHTTVETLRTDLIAKSGKLLAAFLMEVTDNWEAWPCI